MKSKPSTGFWLAWFLVYTALDLGYTAVTHGSFAWPGMRVGLESSLFGATVTWLFALYKWHKADAG